MIVWGHPWWVWLLAVIVGTVSVARMVRLLIFDEFPPADWLRTRFLVITKDTPWTKIAECGFCLAPYLSVVMVAWALLSDWPGGGGFNVWFGVMSYGAAILVSYDQPPDGVD